VVIEQEPDRARHEGGGDADTQKCACFTIHRYALPDQTPVSRRPILCLPRLIRGTADTTSPDQRQIAIYQQFLPRYPPA
jgi:hypothetical protein